MTSFMLPSGIAPALKLRIVVRRWDRRESLASLPLAFFRTDITSSTVETVISPR